MQEQSHLGDINWQRLAGPDEDGHVGPAPVVDLQLSALIEEAEEQEFLADELEARREELLRRLGSSP